MLIVNALYLVYIPKKPCLTLHRPSPEPRRITPRRFTGRMKEILPILINICFIHSAVPVRIKRADPLPWHTVLQLNRIIQASNTRALDIENYTKQAAIRQNQRNALLSSSASVLSPMAALAAATSRFSPPELAPLVRADSNSDLLAKYTARSHLLDNSDLIADRRILFGTDLPPAFPQRDIPVPPPMPPPLLPPPVILPRMLQPRMRTRGIAVVETPLVLDEPTTRIFPRPSHTKMDEEEREKLPIRMRAEDSKRRDYVDYVFI
ncbi:hypothetical protein Y032_0003g1226 [Ancylostoma ceylanicum]|uniref:Uncharacterized protein n=1 Tax=Ancylostoma ceylanicum TaxID=53326 RepID=A0A016VVY2_9BILA|nr:hypothetical protein Y032_0003g1226 [Ancylostoma ceylanicum]